MAEISEEYHENAYNKGAKVEIAFLSLFEKYIHIEGKDYRNWYEHFDGLVRSIYVKAKWVLNDKFTEEFIKFEIKGIKRPIDSQCIEFIGNEGYPGWIHSNADYFVFETQTSYVIVERDELQKFAYDMCRKDLLKIESIIGKNIIFEGKWQTFEDKRKKNRFIPLTHEQIALLHDNNIFATTQEDAYHRMYNRRGWKDRKSKKPHRDITTMIKTEELLDLPGTITWDKETIADSESGSS